MCIRCDASLRASSKTCRSHYFGMIGNRKDTAEPAGRRCRMGPRGGSIQGIFEGPELRGRGQCCCGMLPSAHVCSTPWPLPAEDPPAARTSIQTSASGLPHCHTKSCWGWWSRTQRVSRRMPIRHLMFSFGFPDYQ